jgi:hypothetical protein
MNPRSKEPINSRHSNTKEVGAGNSGHEAILDQNGVLDLNKISVDRDLLHLPPTSQEKDYRDILKGLGLDHFDFRRYERTLSKFGIELKITYGKTKSGKRGKPYLTFEKDNKAVPINLGLMGVCLGFVFPQSRVEGKKVISESNEGLLIRINEASSKLKLRDNLSVGSFMVFNIDVLEHTIRKFEDQILTLTMGVEPDVFSQHNSFFRKYDRQLKLEYYGDSPIMIFTDLQKDLVASFEAISQFKNNVGFIFRKPGETDEKLARRKLGIESKYSRLLGIEANFIVYDKGAFKHFVDIIFLMSPKNKQSARRSGETINSAEILLQDEVIEFLNNVSSRDDFKAIHAKRAVQRNEGDLVVGTRAKFPETDILFVKPGDQEFQIQYLNLIGWENPLKEKVGTLPDKTVTYSNVCGLVVVDKDTPTSTRKQLCRVALAQLKRYYPIQPHAVIMAVDERLMKEWSNNGSIIQDKSIQSNGYSNGLKPRKRTTDYDSATIMKRVEPTRVGARVFEPVKSHIGGTKILVEVNYGDKLTHQVGLDMGWVFDINKVWNGIGTKVPYTDGIVPFLDEGMWGLNPRLFRQDLLIQSLKPATIQALRNLDPNQRNYHSADEYIGLELFHRLGREGMENLFATSEKTRQLYKVLNRRGLLSENGFWRSLREKERRVFEEKVILKMLGITHAHQDHTLGSSLLRREIVRGVSPITRALLLADHKTSGDWLVQDTMARKQREEPMVGSSYQVLEYPYELFNGDGKRHQIAENLFVHTLKVEHSIPGSLAFIVEVKHNDKLLTSVAYPGDYRNGDFFAELARMGPIDLLFAEGTNPPGVVKDSIEHTEDSVREKFQQTIAEANETQHLLIIDIVKNNFKRLINVINEAGMRGRTIVISPRIIQRCQMIEIMQQTTSAEERIELPNFNLPHVKVWQRNMHKHPPEHRNMFAQYGAIDQDALSTNPGQYIVIREGHESLDKIRGIAAPVTWIRSVYGDYEASSRNYTNYCHRLAKEKGWVLKREGYHATGHGPLLNSDHPDAEGGILAQMHEAKAKKIAIIHTQRRKAVLDAMLTYPQLVNQTEEFIWRMNHPQKPGDKGHYIPLWTK